MLISLSDPPSRKEEAILERERNDREKKRLATIQMAEQNKKVKIRMGAVIGTTPERQKIGAQTRKGRKTTEEIQADRTGKVKHPANVACDRPSPALWHSLITVFIPPVER